MEFKRGGDRISSNQKAKQVPKLNLDQVIVNLPNEHSQTQLNALGTGELSYSENADSSFQNDMSASFTNNSSINEDQVLIDLPR